MSTIYVVDRRIRYDVSYAISEVNTAPSLDAAVVKAKEWATRSGQTYYVHQLSPGSSHWQPIAMVTP